MILFLNFSRMIVCKGSTYIFQKKNASAKIARYVPGGSG